MFPHAQHFEKWLRHRSPHAATPVHYTSGLKLFFAWAGKPPTAITLHNAWLSNTPSPTAHTGRPARRDQFTACHSG